jgi:hypothetical protein
MRRSKPANRGKMIDNPLAQRMRAALTTDTGRRLYRMRQAIVKPVIAHIKEVRAFRRVALRRLRRVRAEWQLICTTHNLLKLFRYFRSQNARLSAKERQISSHWITPRQLIERDLAERFHQTFRAYLSIFTPPKLLHSLSDDPQSHIFSPTDPR